MDWFTEDPVRATIIVGAIGFVGALMGSLVGFVSTFVTTSRQIQRQERDVRREIYLAFMVCALDLQTTADRLETVAKDVSAGSEEMKQVIIRKQSGEDVGSEIKRVRTKITDLDAHLEDIRKQHGLAMKAMYISVESVSLIAPLGVLEALTTFTNVLDVDKGWRTPQGRAARSRLNNAMRQDIGTDRPNSARRSR